MSVQPSPFNDLPGTFTAMVADAAMTLPPLTREQDPEFLRQALMLALDAFWDNYLMLQPEDVQKLYLEAVDRDDAPAVMEWYMTYANFREDVEAERRGKNILEEIDGKLPEVLKTLYDDFGLEEPKEEA